MSNEEYFQINRENWNRRTELHLQSDWYRHEAFRQGETSLKEIELEILGDVGGQSILHLQCHFGQDTISLARMGARAVGVDFSDRAIDEARRLADELGVEARFVCCNVYDAASLISERFDRVFVSYGAIGWLPDLQAWARLVAGFLRPGGQLVLVEFHPFIWTFDDDFRELRYDYCSAAPIIEEQQGSYGNPTATAPIRSVGWNHGLGKVVSCALEAGLQLQSLQEFDYSPYACFSHAVEAQPGRFRIEHIAPRIPMVYALTARKLAE